jgi:hypothetical protein
VFLNDAISINCLFLASFKSCNVVIEFLFINYVIKFVKKLIIYYMKRKPDQAREVESLCSHTHYKT